MSYGNGSFVATNRRGAFSSSDGFQWNPINLPIKVNSVRYLNGAFWAVGPGAILQAGANSALRFEVDTWQRLSDGVFQVLLLRPQGATVRIESSSDLRTWSEIPAIERDDGIVEVMDKGSFERRFFRAVAH